MKIGEQIALKRSRWRLAIGFLTVLSLLALFETALLCALFGVNPENKAFVAMVWSKVWPFGNRIQLAKEMGPMPADRALFLDDDVRRMHHHIDRMFEEAMNRMDQQMLQMAHAPVAFSTGNAHLARPAEHFRYLQQDIDRLFRDALQEQSRLAMTDDSFYPWRSSRVSPMVELRDAGDHFIAQLRLPTAAASNIQVRVEGRLLLIQARNDEEASQGGASRKFETRIILPGAVDGAGCSAVCENGILLVRVPKQSAPEAKKTL